MKSLFEYLSTKVKIKINTNDIIYANDNNIKEIIIEEVKRLGNYADLNHIDVSQCKSLERAFAYNSNFCGDVSQWDVSNVENMDSLFAFCKNFNSDLNNWNVSKVKNMYRLFYGAHSFNQPLNKWDVSNVENMGSMFGYAESFNQNISNWNPAKINKKIQCQNIWSGKCPIKERFKPKFPIK